jgi:hypothetical protein
MFFKKNIVVDIGIDYLSQSNSINLIINLKKTFIMPFNPNSNHVISLEEASVLTANFRKKFPDSIKANAYGKRDMQVLLAQQNCVGFRIYNGIDEKGNQQLVIVGVDENGNDLYEGVLLDRSQPCPNVCSDENPLNKNT